MAQMYHNLFNDSPLIDNLLYFHFFFNHNKQYWNKHPFTYVFIHSTFISMGQDLLSIVLACIYLVLIDTARLLSKKAVMLYISTSNLWKYPFPHIPASKRFYSSILFSARLMRVKWYITCFQFAFPWLLVNLNIFSYAYWPSALKKFIFLLF